MLCPGLNHYNLVKLISLSQDLVQERNYHSVSPFKDLGKISKYFLKYVKSKEKSGISESNRILRMYETTKQNFYAPERLEMKNYIHTSTVKQEQERAAQHKISKFLVEIVRLPILAHSVCPSQLLCPKHIMSYITVYNVKYKFIQ